MKKVGYLLFVLIVFLGLISFVYAQATDSTASTTTAGTTTDNSVTQITDKKDIGGIISQDLKPEDGGLKPEEAKATNVDLKKVDSDKTKVDFKEGGSMQIKGRDYSGFSKGDGELNKPTITVDKKGKTVEGSFTSEKDSKVTLGNQDVPITKGAKVEQKEGVIKVKLPEGAKLTDVPKRNEDLKTDQNASQVIYSGKFSLPNGMKVDGELSFSDGQAYIDKGQKATLNGVQLQGNVEGQKWVNDKTSVYFDGKNHPETNGAYVSFGEKNFIIASNNDLASSAVNFVKGNPYVTKIDDARSFAMQAYSKSMIELTNRDATGQIPLLQSKGGGIISVDNQAFFTENGNLYFRAKDGIIKAFGDTSGKLTYPMEFKAFDNNGKNLVPPNGKIYIGPSKQYAAININAEQWNIGGKTYTNQWKDNGFGLEIYNLPSNNDPRVNVNPSSKEIPIPDFKKYAGPETTYRSKNFNVYCPNGNARMYAENLEFWRYKTSIEWTGGKLPDWSRLVTVTIDEGPYSHSGGGATKFSLINGETVADMKVTGSLQKLIDDVLPHEINHLVTAQNYQGFLPRWIDEGMATYIEKNGGTNMNRMLTQFFQQNKVMDLNQLFSIEDYPKDSLPLYAQGESVTQYLIDKGGGGVDGKRRLFDALKSSKQIGWDGTLKQYYGIDSVNQLQSNWYNWIKLGKIGL